MGYSEAGGKLIHEKNQKQKISWHCPFNYFMIISDTGTQWFFFLMGRDLNAASGEEG